MGQTPTTASLTSQRDAEQLSEGVSSRERKQPARPLSTHSLGLERIFASSSLELSSRISFEGCMSSKGKRLM